LILEINKLIKNGKLEKALEIVNEEILKPSNIGTDIYHELLFTKARMYVIKYKETKPIDNNLLQQAKEGFATGNITHQTLHGKQHPYYQIAIQSMHKIFTELNPSKKR
jgi:hypothetical protein